MCNPPKAQSIYNSVIWNCGDAKRRPLAPHTLALIFIPEARHPLVFHGFDGNRESRQHGATFLVERLALWAKFPNRDLNSHHSWLGTYLLMWGVYKPMRPSGVLTSAQLIEILTARRMPEPVEEEGASLRH